MNDLSIFKIVSLFSLPFLVFSCCMISCDFLGLVLVSTEQRYAMFRLYSRLLQPKSISSQLSCVIVRMSVVRKKD